MNPQVDCPLFRLPPELRAQIYFHSLTSASPILDPAIGPHILSEHKSVPTLGTTLARTCHRISDELDFRPLYHSNEFSFTQPATASHFLDNIPPQYKTGLTALTLDIRANVAKCDGQPNFRQLRRWSHYLCCSVPVLRSCKICERHGSLHRLTRTLPLQTVVLDLCEAQRTLGQVTGLGRVGTHRALWSWCYDCGTGMPATARGVVVKVRLLTGGDGEVKEMQVPGRWSEDLRREDERVEALRRWMKETFSPKTGRLIVDGEGHAGAT